MRLSAKSWNEAQRLTATVIVEEASLKIDHKINEQQHNSHGQQQKT